MKTEVQKTTSRKIKEDQINELREVYRNGNMNSVYGWLRRNGFNFKKHIVEFGLDNKTNWNEKSEWLKESDLRFHIYSILVRSRKTGWGYNRIRGVEIEIL